MGEGERARCAHGQGQRLGGGLGNPIGEVRTVRLMSRERLQTGPAGLATGLRYTTRARAPLAVALALDTTNVGLDCDFDDIGRFGAGKRHKRCAAGGAAFGLFASVLYFRHHWQAKRS
jgi:hypothetical protein